jgi:hypothetical protein
MNAIRPLFGPGRLRVSQIAYYCDVTSATGSVIPLGVMLDVRVGTLYGLGLKARTTLSPTEAALVGHLARSLVSRPFEMLKREFDRVWSTVNPESCFAILSEQHSGALRFEPAKSERLSLPRPLVVRATSDAGILKQWAVDQINICLDRGFWNLLETHWPDAATEAERDYREKLVA